MNKIDHEYITELIDKVRAGDSDAFAEIYAATYQKQFEMAFKQLGDYQLAQEVLQEVYIYAIKHLDSLLAPRLLTQWLNKINCEICFRYRAQDNEYINIEGSSFRFRQIAELPFSEAQAIMLRYCSDLGISETSRIMDCDRAAVKRYTLNGINRLNRIMQK